MRGYPNTTTLVESPAILQPAGCCKLVLAMRRPAQVRLILLLTKWYFLLRLTSDAEALFLLLLITNTEAFCLLTVTTDAEAFFTPIDHGHMGIF